jgi:uncharacterized protein YjbJ (UPF0337 family)
MKISDTQHTRKTKPDPVLKGAQPKDTAASAKSAQSMQDFKMNGQWKQHVGAAKVMWGKLTQDQLLQTEGRFQKLAGLIQEKYAISRMEAEKQVRTFMEKTIQ